VRDEEQQKKPTRVKGTRLADGGGGAGGPMKRKIEGHDYKSEHVNGVEPNSRKAPPIPKGGLT